MFCSTAMNVYELTEPRLNSALLVSLILHVCIHTHSYTGGSVCPAENHLLLFIMLLFIADSLVLLVNVAISSSTQLFARRL